jgi:hypothetical protein
MTRELCSVRRRLCSASLRKGYALRCVRGTLGRNAAAFLKHSRHRQSSPLTGIGRRAVSASHQHSPDRLQENSTPQRGQARRREVGPGLADGLAFSNRLVMNRAL